MKHNRIASCPPPPVSDLCFKSKVMIMKLWEEQFFHIDLQQKEKKENGKYSESQLDKSERKMYDEMMSYSRLYNVAVVGACKPVLLHPILMSIIFEHYKQLNQLVK